MTNHSLQARAFAIMMRKRQVVFCLICLSIYLLIALCGYADLLPDFQERIGSTYQPPSWEWGMLFGTDVFGRSVLFKILAGAETAVTMGFLVTIIAVPVGIILGGLSGYYGGKVDAIVVWLYSVVVSVPGILLLIAISYSLGKGLMAVCIAMAATYWVGLCRLIRGEFIREREREYVVSTKALGGGHFRAIFRHILPNVVHLAIVTASLMVLTAIKAEVMLTFLGVGIQDGASWGTMISAAPGELTNGIWWPLASVVMTMFFIIYSLNVVGDALRDALDPKLFQQ